MQQMFSLRYFNDYVILVLYVYIMVLWYMLGIDSYLFVIVQFFIKLLLSLVQLCMLLFDVNICERIYVESVFILLF